jgi:signal peptidase II
MDAPAPTPSASTRAAVPTVPPATRWRLVAGVVALVLVVDQVTKWLVQRDLAGRAPVELVGSLRLRLLYNRGSAFSIGSRFAPLIALVAVAVVLVLLRSHHRLPGRLAAVSLALVVGGATGNLLDRVFRSGHGFLGGPVVDFVDLQWWPVFNVADAAIVTGALLLALNLSRESSA